jgi:hypothetical protein
MLAEAIGYDAVMNAELARHLHSAPLGAYPHGPVR